jgi:hypothetical protein
VSDGVITDAEEAKHMNDQEALDQLGITADQINLDPYWTKSEQMKQSALTHAVKARVPNANADEIVRAAVTFEQYLTGKTDE